jgi:hypothetical protein
MLIKGFSMGDSTVFLSWLEFFASLALSPSCENANPLPRGWLQHQGKHLEDVVVVGDRLILMPEPLLRSLLWLKL